MNDRRRRHHHHAGGAMEGRASRTYDTMARRFMRGFYRRVAADIAKSAGQGASVLDVGTGPGVLLAELGRIRPDLALTGADISADMIDAAKRNLGEQAALHTADVESLPFGDDTFDLVVSSLSSHHWDDPAAGAAEIARVTRPGGTMLVYDFRWAAWDDLASPERLELVGRDRFRTGWFLPLRCTRFEVAVRSA
ncbi:hypothetical protein GCM10027447_14450 [Glycomyces halotolerans]